MRETDKIFRRGKVERENAIPRLRVAEGEDPGSWKGRKEKEREGKRRKGDKAGRR